MSDAKSFPKRPLLISLGIVFSWFNAVMIGGALLVAFLRWLVPGGKEEIPVSGEMVSVGDFLASAGPVLIGNVILLIAIAVALQRRRLWPRNAVVLLWGALAGVLFVHNLFLGALVTPFLGFSVWYFFYKPNVLAYFALQRQKPENFLPSEARGSR